jgi:hypothetical protein
MSCWLGLCLATLLCLLSLKYTNDAAPGTWHTYTHQLAECFDTVVNKQARFSILFHLRNSCSMSGSQGILAQACGWPIASASCSRSAQRAFKSASREAMRRASSSSSLLEPAVHGACGTDYKRLCAMSKPNLQPNVHSCFCVSYMQLRRTLAWAQLPAASNAVG